MSNTFNIPRYTPTLWEVVTPVQPPDVTALIKHTYNGTITELITETNIHSKLVVPQHSLLVLTCLAIYPIMWYKDGKLVPGQISFKPSPLYNPALQRLMPQAHHNYSDQDYTNSSIQMWATGYQATLRFENVTTNMNGTYECKGTTVEDDAFKLALRINVNSTRASTDGPQLLHAGFDQVRRPFDLSANVSLIYYSPVGSQTDTVEYLTSPSHQRIDASTKQNDTLRMITEQLSPSIRKVNVVFPVRARIVYGGDYGIWVMPKNGTAVLLYTFTLNEQKYAGERMETVGDQQRLEIELGQVRDLQAYLNTFSSLDAVSISVFAQTSFDQGCAYRLIPAVRAAAECGLLGATRLYDNLVGPNFGRIELTIKGTKPCKLQVNMTSARDSQSASFVNIYPTNENTLYAYGKDKNGFVTKASDRDKILNQQMVNETLTLECVVSMCDWAIVGWSKWTFWPDGESDWYSYATKTDQGTTVNSFADPSVHFSYNQTERLATYSMTFTSLQVFHSASYACVTIKPQLNSDRVVMDGGPFHFTIFGLEVKSPQSPTFVDGKTGPRDIVLQEGQQQELVCQLDGLPKPNITWESPDGRAFNETTDSERIQISEPGLYQCTASNKYGIVSRLFKVRYAQPAASILSVVIAVPAAVIAIVTSAVGIQLWMRRRARHILAKRIAEMLRTSPETVKIDTEAPLNDQVDILPYERKYEIQREQFTLTKLIGEGEFGKVYKGEFTKEKGGNPIPVAVKVPKDPTDLRHCRDLVAELKIMTHIRPHVNVISLVGACTSTADKRLGSVFVLTEYCGLGSLLHHLRNHFSDSVALAASGTQSTSSSLSGKLLSYAFQAANGMEYLAAEKIIHRDLALRNLLLTVDDLVKISDFGMSRHARNQSAYHKHLASNVPIPIYWMAPEALQKGHYTQKSDIWSFGVVLWEMFTCGGSPYAELELGSVQELFSCLSRGHRLQKPAVASDEVYALMLDCWAKEADQRPTFSGCKRRIGHILEKGGPYNRYAILLTKLTDAWRNVTSPEIPVVTNNEVASEEYETDNVTAEALPVEGSSTHVKHHVSPYVVQTSDKEQPEIIASSYMMP